MRQYSATDADVALCRTLSLTDLIAGVTELAQYRLGALDEALSQLGHQDFGGVPSEQRRTHIALQLAYAAGERRLSRLQMLRRRVQLPVSATATTWRR